MQPNTFILSYRGPAAAPAPGQPAPGGVQAGLDGLFRTTPGVVWVHAEAERQGGNLVMVLGDPDHRRQLLCSVDADTWTGHYHQAANGTLWALTHDMPRYAAPAPMNGGYAEFNRVSASQIAAVASPGAWIAVQDYQLALVPGLLRQARPDLGTSIFWHIPWPESIPEEYLLDMRMVAEGLLGANLLGFHTLSYQDRFCRFVETHLSDSFTVVGNTVRHNASGHVCAVAVQPLGVDFGYWEALAEGALPSIPGLPAGIPYVLSAERLDYTKGVRERYEAINAFFQAHPQWRGKVCFLEVAGRTRTGIEAFERYWLECEALEQQIRERWGTGALVWHKEPIPSNQLAPLYRGASVVAVGPLRDGLNLVASECVAAADLDNSPVLCLSRGAGVWEQLGTAGALELVPTDTIQMVAAFHQALDMAPRERQRRMTFLQQAVRINPLKQWVAKFCTDTRAPGRAA